MFVGRRFFKNFDWAVLLVTLAIILAGLPVMFSASTAKEGSAGLFAEHLLRLGIGLAVMLAVVLVDYHFITRWAYLFYGLNLAALLFVEISGIIGFGARRWLALGPVALQPSELFKITLILVLAGYLSRSRQTGKLGWTDLGWAGLFVAVPFLLILKQPDLGTAGIVMLIFVTMLVMAGIPGKIWSVMAGSAAVLASAVFAVFRFGIVDPDRLLRPYQIKRIMVLFDPSLDPLGASYHINQSKIAVGSGQIFGKGFLNGTQNQLRFLPQQHTDFIFSVLAEEWGFAGVLLVMILYLSLILLALGAARDARDRMGNLIALGAASMIIYHAVINIGMTVGFMPVVGLPLPLMSYGGSSFLVVMIGIGLVINVRMRRFIF